MIAVRETQASCYNGTIVNLLTPKFLTNGNKMNHWSIVAIAVGASIGALLRWILGLFMNGWWPTVPLGTLAANLIGGYLIGIAMTFFHHHPGLDPAWKLLLITGFLGGLTTFSTFSAENVQLLMNGRLVGASLHGLLHLAGSLAATWLGILTYQYWRNLPS